MVKRADTNLFIVLFAFFCASGCCSLIYQTVWMRLAFAAFGIITPVLSVVLSVFMMGLSLGSWLGGKYIGAMVAKSKIPAVAFYGCAELLIGLGGAFIVPQTFHWSANMLLQAGESNSAGYMTLSAALISLSLFPWCFLLGTTFPFALSIVKERGGSEDSFSHLYLANVLGAVLGVVLSAFVLIEFLGFTQTLWLAAGLNFSIAAVSFYMVSSTRKAAITEAEKPKITVDVVPKSELKWMYILLFTTGFCSMAMEVIWTRGFTPTLANMTYSFASLLIVYLIATAVGSWLYRKDLANNKLPRVSQLIASLIVFSLLPIVLNDPFLGLGMMQALLVLKGMAPSVVGDTFRIWLAAKAALALISIFPLCLKLGYLTPMVIDTTSAGAPDQAGTDYAINTVGGILGPLVGCYFLLPAVGVKGSLILMTVPFVICYLGFSKKDPKAERIRTLVGAGVLMTFAAFFSLSSEVPVFGDYKLYRDHTATVIVCGQGLDKQLLVNGHGVTNLVQDTKVMALMPILLHHGPVKTALNICFGMGTTFRSLLNWNVETTAVELVPSVKTAFPNFWSDANEVMANPRGKIVIDDGRRYLMRTHEKYDLITIDVPPPFESSGVSLLFSEQFYKVVKDHLNENGVLQTFISPDANATTASVTRALLNSFQHVRVFRGKFGFFFLASDADLKTPDLAAFQKDMPEIAKLDFIEWNKSPDTDNRFKEMLTAQLATERSLKDLLKTDSPMTIVDDVPATEYFVLRRYFGLINPRHIIESDKNASVAK